MTQIRGHRLCAVVLGSIVCLLTVIGMAWAQATSGTISGTVKDETGAVLPGATIVVTNTDTSTDRTLQADDSGRYRAPNLPPGPYEVTATLDGFTSIVRRGIELTIGREAVVDISLKLGTISDQIEVVGEAPTIQTTTASTGGLVSQEQISNLPLNGRSYIELATLTPGVSQNDTAGRSNSEGFGMKISASGARFNQNLFTVDGTTMNNEVNTTGSVSGNMLGVEAIREFQILTNSFSAAYGRHTGAIVSAVTKSGTNSFHGSLFEFHRNESLDARNFFDTLEERPPFTRNQFGGSFGGPVVRDRTFFFGTYEGLRETLGRTSRATVPTAFFRSLPIAPPVRPWVDVYPLPNGALLDAERGDYVTETVDSTREHYAAVRVDHQLGRESSIFGRYSFNDAKIDLPGALVTGQGRTTRFESLTLEHTAVRGSNFLNQVQFGFTRSKLDLFEYLMEGFTLPQMTFTEYEDGFPTVSITSLTALGGSATLPNRHRFHNLQFSDTVTWNRGRHNIRSGGNVEFLNFEVNSSSRNRGVFAFASRNDFRANIPRSFEGLLTGSDAHRKLRQPLFAMFVQDDIQLRSNLTLNVGVRYDPTGSITEADDKLYQLLDFTSPTATRDDTTRVDALVENPSKANVAPRFGLAWDPGGDGKMAVRAGAGVFYELLTTGQPMVQQTAKLNPPAFNRVALIEPSFVIDFPNTFFTQRDRFSGFSQLEGIQFDADRSVMYKWNVNVQRQVWGGAMIEAGYSGSHGSNLWRVVHTNLRSPIVREDGRLFVPATAPLRQPNFGRMALRVSDSSSDYHGGTIGFTKRQSGGLQFQASYTFSKSIDEGANIASGEFQNEPDQGSRNYFDKDRGLSPFDLRQSLVVNFTYELRFAENRSGVTGTLANGWSIGTLVRLRSGQPFSPQVGFDSARTTFGPRYPDLAPGADKNPVLGGPAQYFDPTAFLLPEAGVIGNLGRATVIGPGLSTVDLMLAKITSIAGNVRLHVRAEAYNLLNRTNFSLPVVELFNTNGTRRADAGRITTTATPARQFQLSLKLMW